MYSMFLTMALGSMSSEVGCHGCAPAPAPVSACDSCAPAPMPIVSCAPVCAPAPVCDPCAAPAKKKLFGGLFKGHKKAAECCVTPVYAAPTYSYAPPMYAESAPCAGGVTTVPPMMGTPMPAMAPAPAPAAMPAKAPMPAPMPK